MKQMENHNKIRQALEGIAERFSLDIIYVFGSQAKSVQKIVEGEMPVTSLSASSDLDVGVRPAKGKSLSIRKKVLLSIELEDIFKVNKVDLLVIPEVDPFMAANIICGERLFCKDEYKADEYDLYILRRAGDLLPFERERITLILGGPEDESGKNI